MRQRLALGATLLLFALLIVLPVLLPTGAQSGIYLMMHRCGGEFSLSGDHVSRHDSEEAAREHAEARFAEGYDLAYIYDLRATENYRLLALKTTSDECYNGSFKDWYRP
jgi:hypothetical protein